MAKRPKPSHPLPPNDYLTIRSPCRCAPIGAAAKLALCTRVWAAIKPWAFGRIFAIGAASILGIFAPASLVVWPNRLGHPIRAAPKSGQQTACPTAGAVVAQGGGDSIRTTAKLGQFTGETAPFAAPIMGPKGNCASVLAAPVEGGGTRRLPASLQVRAPGKGHIVGATAKLGLIAGAQHELGTALQVWPLRGRVPVLATPKFLDGNLWLKWMG